MRPHPPTEPAPGTTSARVDGRVPSLSAQRPALARLLKGPIPLRNDPALTPLSFGSATLRPPSMAVARAVVAAAILSIASHAAALTYALAVALVGLVRVPWGGRGRHGAA